MQYNAGETSGDSGRTVQRYIRLTYLKTELLGAVDLKKLSHEAGIKLSYLSEEEQGWIIKIAEDAGIYPSGVQAETLRELSEQGKLTYEQVYGLLKKQKRIAKCSGLRDSAGLKGTLAKAKANAAQGIPELIETASNQRYKENLNPGHQKNAKYGWYRYDSRFGLPVYGELERYNIFHVEMLIRHDVDGRWFLYDVVNIKKEMDTPLKQ